MSKIVDRLAEGATTRQLRIAVIVMKVAVVAIFVAATWWDVTR